MVEDARSRLLEAGLQVIARAGPDGLTTKAVAEAAGVSKPLVHYHFGSRDGLLDAIAAWLLEDTRRGLERFVRDYPNPRHRLRALTEALLEDPGPEPAEEVGRVMRFWLAGPNQERLALLRAFVEETVKDGIATGALRRGVDPQRIADWLLAEWLGATAMRAAGDLVDVPALRAAAVRRLEAEVE